MMRSFTLWILLSMAAPTTVLVAQDTIPQAEPTPETPTEQVAESQPEPKKDQAWKQKIYYGGYINFSLGTYRVFGVEPMIGYKLTERISLGAKFRYEYISDNRYSSEYNTSTYGASVFGRMKLIKQLYFHAEYAGYNYELYDEFGNSEREWVPFLFIGGGLNQPLGKRASLNAQVLFDVLQSSKSPYRKWEPFYSVGIGVGF